MEPETDRPTDDNDTIIRLDDMPSNLRSLMVKLEAFNDSLREKGPMHAVSVELVGRPLVSQEND